MNNRFAIGADIGGSHITAAVVDVTTGHLIPSSTQKVTVNASAGAQEILSAWALAIGNAINASEVSIGSIGIAMPGPFDYPNGISLIKGVAKYESLFGLHIREALLKELHFQGEIYFENDASCFAIGESWTGEGVGCDRVVAITLGTGLGGTFLINNEIQREGKGVPPDGYIYNLPYRDGIAEDYISTRWLINEFNRSTGLQITEVKDINNLAENNHAAAKQLFENMGTALGEVLAPWLSGFQAQRLIIGGNIRKAHAFFLPALTKKLKAHNVHTSVHISNNGEQSAITGAAYLCKKHLSPTT